MPLINELTPTKVGDIMVWWIPQIPGKSFCTPVDTLQEGKKLMDILARYDAFQYENNIKPDYSNMGGISVAEMFDGKLDWCDVDASELWEEWEELNAKS